MKCWYFYLSVKIWNQRENAFEFFNIFFYRFISTRFRDYARSTCRLSPNNENCKKKLFLEFVCNFPNQWILFLRNTKYLGVLAYNSMDNIRIYTNCSWLQVSTDELLTIGKIQNDLPQESFALNYWEISKRFVLNFIVP